MLTSLAFISSPADNGFRVFGLFFHAYGICYVVGVAAAITLLRWRWGKRGGDPELVYNVTWWAFPAGLVGARLYFLATTPSQIPDHWWGPLAIWDGGLGIWGGVALGAVVGVWYLRRQMPKNDVYRFMNCAAPALLVAQAIGRIGNYFNQELFGKPSTLPWALKISPAHRPIGYEHFATFQPTFLYELIWDLSLACLLVWLDGRRKVRPPAVLALYVAGYSAFRIFEETLRIDYSVHILGMRLNFWIALIGALGGLTAFVLIQFKQRPELAYEVEQTPSTGAYSQSGKRPAKRVAQ